MKALKGLEYTECKEKIKYDKLQIKNLKNGKKQKEILKNREKVEKNEEEKEGF